MIKYQVLTRSTPTVGGSGFERIDLLSAYVHLSHSSVAAIAMCRRVDTGVLDRLFLRSKSAI